MALNSAEASEIAAFDTVALSWVSLIAVSDTQPMSASTVESVTKASTNAGVSPLNAFEISGSPISASMALNRMFCGCQPSELKARLMPTAVSPVWVELNKVASISEVLRASSTTLPAVEVTVASSI